MKPYLVIFLYLLFQQGEAKRKILHPYKDDSVLSKGSYGASVGEPLILTPLLETNKIQEAQQAALVQYAKFQNVKSYAGYFTVDKRFDSNMWFWYFPSADNVAEDPVVLWLNGGPGASSLNGLFDENGPFIVNEDYSVTLREYSWHKNQSLLFFDNPVGTGFSFTTNGYAENETKVGEDLHSAITQFFTLFPELQKNDFYISGESYAGKYLPALGYTIRQKNPEATLKINLKGLLIGDGWTDPINQLQYGKYVYEVGLVSDAIRQQLDQHRDQTILEISLGRYESAANYWSEMTRIIEEKSGVNIYNYIWAYDQSSSWYYFIDTEEVRAALHVGATPFGGDSGNYLDNDMLQSVASWVEELLENYPILVYTGQIDVIVGYPMVVDYLQKLNFSGSEEYRSSTRKIWSVNGQIAGYYRTGGNLVELLVRNAGHMVPMDQPAWAYDMLYRFVRRIPFS